MQRHVARSALVRYGIAVLCVTVAVHLALWLRPVTLVGGQLSLIAILITGWVCGLRPALVAWVLATLAFTYYFTPPLDSFRVNPPELPRLIIFALLGLFIATVSAARRKAQDLLESARAQLETRVRERTTDLERSNERLRESEEQWRAVFENNPTMYFMVDGAGTVVSVNPFGAEQLGYTVDELVGRSVLTLYGEPDRDAVRAHVAVCLQQLGRACRWEVWKLRKDGTMLWARETAKAMRRAGGEPIVLVASEDITEHKEAEEERQERRWMIESMDRVNLAIQGTNDLEQMMSDVLEATLSIFDCDRAWLVYPCDPEAESHGVKMQRTRPEFPGLYAVGEDVPMDRHTASVFRTVRSSSGPVQFGPQSDHPLPADLAKSLGIQSRMVMAVYPKGDQPYMFGLSQCAYPRAWTAREQRLFQEIGRRLTDALTSLTIFRRLRESEKRYRHIFESTGVSIWEEDFSQAKAAIDDLRASGVRDFRAYFAAHPQFVQDAIAMVKIVDINAASLKLFAAENKDQLLSSLDKIFVAETNRVFAGELVAIAEGRTSFEAETVLQTLKGEKLTALFTITFPTPSARFDSVLVTIMNITERKQAEYLTRQVFEGSPDAVAVIGRDYRYRRVNPVYERSWGMPAETIVGMHVVELRGSEVFEQALKANLDRCFAGEQVTSGEWLTIAVGRVYHVRTYTPLRSTSNEVNAALVISRDLTEHMLAVEALQKVQAELAHITRVTTLGELAASGAHEVNQPLAAIVADANASLNWLAAAHPDLESVRGALDAIVRDGHRAGEVIQRIRQLASKGAPRKDAVDLNDVVRDVVPLVRAELRHQDISLMLDLASKLPPVLGDRIQLQQVLLNLVMNGVEAMGSVTGRPRRLVIRSEPHDRDHVGVTVQDTGSGIAANELDHVFSAFFTTKPSGMGLGLSISRSIIEAHGGRLWTTPNRPHGAVFHFALPVAKLATNETVPDEGRVDSPPPGSVPSQPRSLKTTATGESDE